MDYGLCFKNVGVRELGVDFGVHRLAEGGGSAVDAHLLAAKTVTVSTPARSQDSHRQKPVRLFPWGGALNPQPSALLSQLAALSTVNGGGARHRR